MTENPVFGFELIDSDIIAKWQGIADLLAKIITVPAALIMKTENEYMEVLVSSNTDNNPYHGGDKEQWHGLYCETVIKTQKELCVPNATADKHWDKNPDIKLGMIAYLGYPINFPDQTPFGTLCVLDNKENTFSPLHKQLLLRLRDTIEMDITLLQKESLRNLADNKLKHLNLVLLAIRNVVQLITKEKDLDRLIQGVCDNLIETRGYHGAWLALLDKQGNPHAAAEAGLGDEFNSLKKILAASDKAYCTGLCLKNPGVKMIPSPRDTCGTCPLIDKYNNLSAMSIRLEHGEVIYGLLSVSLPSNLAQDEFEHALFQEVADDIAFALYNLEVIGKQKLANIKLEASEQNLRSYIEHAPDGVFVADENGKYLEVNPAACLITGYSEHELLNLSIPDLIQREYQEKAEEHFKEIKEKGSARGEFGFITKDGEKGFWEVGAVKLSEKLFLSFVKDITKSKKQHEALEQSETRFEALHNASFGGIGIHDKGVILDCNQGLSKITGYSQQELIGMDGLLLVAKQSRQWVMDHILAGYEKPYEAVGVRKDGWEYPLRLEGRQIPYRGKEVRVVEFRDITEQKQAEKDLLNSKEMLISSQSVAHICSYSTDLNETDLKKDIWVCSPEFYKIFGTDNTYPHTIADWQALVHPDHREEMIVYYNDVVTKRTSFNKEYKIIRSNDGAERWVQGTGELELDRLGNPVRMYGAIQDITERKLVEEALIAEKDRLSVTLKSIGDGVISTDTNGNVVLLNKVAEDMTGWSTAEAAGRPLSEVFTIINEITREKCKNPVEWVLTTGEIVELANHTALVSRDNREIIIADSAAPVKNAKDEIIGVVLVFRDLTEKKKLDMAVEVSSKLESLGVLAGGIAHDFNNLLGGIYGYIDIASELSKDEKVTGYLSKTITTIERARNLTGQLLTFAKGGSPVQKIIPLFPFVQETAQFALSGSEISCVFDVQPDLWNGNYDSNQIGQVIDNLIINAQQAMPVGGSITVSARNIYLDENEHPTLTKGDYVRISVKDVGIGIPKELLNKIFDPFFTTKTKGHGLGLATCYSIINRHGGCIDVYSEQGKGTVFHVYLPAANESVSETEKTTTKQHKGSGTFLVMDDEEVMQETISDMLSDFGYTVVCKGNGKDAVDYVASELKAGRFLSGMIFDLTVAGGMGGKDAVAEIRKLNNEIPVFVASGYADDPIMKNPGEYGFTGSICKPLTRIELIEMLAKHINKKD